MHQFRPGDIISSEKMNSNFMECSHGQVITCAPAYGWALDTFAARKHGNRVTMNFSIRRTGGQVNAAAGIAQTVGTLSESLTPMGGNNEVAVVACTTGYFFVLRIIGTQLTIKSFGQGTYPAGARFIGSATWLV